MSWAHCGKDSKGRPIGYAYPATCDYPGCNKKIDRGLAYACGGMHGENEHDCEGYFCYDHLTYISVEQFEGDDKSIQVCLDCAKQIGEVSL